MEKKLSTDSRSREGGLCLPAAPQKERQDLRDRAQGDLTRDTGPGQAQQGCPCTKECGNRQSIMTQRTKDQGINHCPSSFSSLSTAEDP